METRSFHRSIFRQMRLISFYDFLSWKLRIGIRHLAASLDNNPTHMHNYIKPTHMHNYVNQKGILEGVASQIIISYQTIIKLQGYESVLSFSCFSFSHMWCCFYQSLSHNGPERKWLSYSNSNIIELGILYEYTIYSSVQMNQRKYDQSYQHVYKVCNSLAPWPRY